MTATAPSKRIRFRYSKEIRRGRAAVKQGTSKLPKAPFIEVQAAGGGLVKVLIKQGYNYVKNTAIVVEWSLDGSTSWTASSFTGYVAGDTLLTTAVIATGVKFFRARLTNSVGTGPNSNIPSVTIT